MKDPWESDPTESRPKLTYKRPVPKKVSPTPSVMSPTRSVINPARPVVTPAPSVGTGSTEVEGFLQFKQENFVQGLIWSEILGRPKAKRGRR